MRYGISNKNVFSIIKQNIQILRFKIVKFHKIFIFPI